MSEEIEIVDNDAPPRGFVTLGINTGEDNIRYCYALACSIKACDPNASITLIVDKGQLGNVQSFYSPQKLPMFGLSSSHSLFRAPVRDFSARRDFQG